MRQLVKIEYAVIFCLFLLFTTDSIAQDTWQIGEDYRITFSGNGADGTFSGLSGEINFNPEQLGQSTFSVSLDPATILTGNKTKDKHARGSSWFNVKAFPNITFESTQIRQEDIGYAVDGKLTMHGVTKPVTIAFTFEERSGNEGVFTGNIVVDRQEFDITGPWLGFVVGDEFAVEIVVPVYQ